MLRYLREERRIGDDEIRALRFGFVPPRFDGHELSGRLVMPLFDPYGELVAITSRDVRPDSEFKHWHESFEKTHYVYGLNVAKRAIIEKKKVIVVEGQFDTAYLHTLGAGFTVGILGSALSFMHATLLLRYCSEIYLLFDGDKGGREATERSMQMYRDKRLDKHHIKFYPVVTPWGKDPDDLTAPEIVELCKTAKEKSEKDNA